ncbi:MAG: hypothetical protein WC755_01500 [Candidatus Woesearchaeota archaeon]|jgi:hypothetical protein
MTLLKKLNDVMPTYKNLRTILFSTLLSSVSFYYSQILGKELLVELHKYDYVSLSEKEIEKETKILQLNDKDYVMQITHKTEEEGVKDIRQLNKKTPFEELWLFLPEKNIWYEVGVRRQVNIGSSGINDPGYYIYEGIIRKNPDVTKCVFYHNHPSYLNIVNNFSIDKILSDKNTPEEKINSLRKFSSYHYRFHSEYHSITPSSLDGDLGSSLLITSIFKLFNSKLKVTYKIVSDFGVTEYTPTEEALICFKSDGEKSRLKLPNSISNCTRPWKSGNIQSEHFLIKYTPDKTISRENINPSRYNYYGKKRKQLKSPRNIEFPNFPVRNWYKR